MSIADQINRLNNAKANIKQAIENKGVTVSDSALLDEYPALISSIPMEGGDPYYEEFYNMRTNNGTNMDSLFARTSGELDLRRVDVSNVTSMRYMFDNSSVSVNIDGWDTSKVTDMSYMFNYFTGSIDVSKLDTSKVTNVNNMFSNANTDNIILTGFSFPKCTSLERMLYNASGTTLDLSSWDISNITSMYYMFAGNFKKIDLTGWNTSNVTNMNSVFYKSSNPLEELIIPDWDMTNVTSSSSFMKDSYMTNLKLIDLSRSNNATIIKIASYLPTRTATTFGTVLVPENTSQATYDTLVAKYWRPIGAAIGPVPTSVDIAAELDEIMPGKSTKVYLGTCEPWNADPSNVELVLVSDNSIATMTEDNEVISTGVVGDIMIEARIIDTQEVIGTKTISVSETDSYPNLIKFRAASALPNNTYNTVLYVNGSSKYTKDLTYDSITDIYSYDAGVPITKISFGSYSNINELIKLNTSNVTDMSSIFYNCKSLTSLDINNWDTSNVTNMGYMFNGCKSLTTLDISNWDTGNVTDMYYMFSDCPSLTSLDISNFNTSNVTTISSTFSGCRSLRELHLDNCNNDTIDRIINSYGFPTNAIEGVTRTIYCKEENAAGLTPPTNWEFSFVSIPDEGPDYINSENPYIQAKFDTQYQGHMNGESGYQWEYSFDGINWHNNDGCGYDEENDIYYGATTEGNETIYFRPNNEQFGEDIGMYRLFENANGLLEAEFHNMDNVRNFENIIVPISPYMDHMFENTNITNIDLSWMNIEEIRNIDYIFSGCTSLETVDISNLNIVNEGYEGDSESEITDMFASCDNLRELHLDNCSRDTIEKIINSVGFPIGDIGVTRTIYCKGENLVTALEAPANWEFHYVDSIIPEEPEMPVDPPVEDIPLYVEGEFMSNTEITEVRTMVNESHTDLGYMFFECENLVSVNTEDWDTSNVTTMSSMFQYCTSLTSLDLSNFDVNALNTMSSMFSDCTSLTTLDLSNWDTSNVSIRFDLDSMFYGCDSLHTLRLDNCSNDTISDIIGNGTYFPTGTIAGVTRTIYCKEENAAGLTAPNGWVFSYVD